MTTLEEKFEALELMLGNQYTGILEAINSLISLAGGAPPGPTTTLADVVSAITTTNQLLVVLRTHSDDHHTALMQPIANIANLLDVMNENGAVNAKALINAILTTACACETDAPILAPPLETSPSLVVDTEKCKRIQFFLDLFGRLLDNIAAYGGAGTTIGTGTLATLITTAIATGGVTGGEIGAVAGPPGVVIGAAVGIIAAAVAAAGSAYLSSLPTQYRTQELQSSLQSVLYLAANAADGDAAFDAAIDASDDLDLVWKTLIKALWWSSWSNDLYSTTPQVDDADYDGSICSQGSSSGGPWGNEPCHDFGTTDIGSHWQVWWPASGDPTWYVDAYGWEISSDQLVDFYTTNPDGTNHAPAQVSYNASQPTVITWHTGSIASNGWKGYNITQYTLHICVPQ